VVGNRSQKQGVYGFDISKSRGKSRAAIAAFISTPFMQSYLPVIPAEKNLFRDHCQWSRLSPFGDKSPVTTMVFTMVLP
jgi:hypothetical protein